MKQLLRGAYMWFGNYFDLHPDDVFNGITDCVKAMKALETGSVLQPSEYNALAWGVNKLVVDNLLDHSPLTKGELAVGKALAIKIAARAKERDGT
jgi:hypothetical protein